MTCTPGVISDEYLAEVQRYCGLMERAKLKKLYIRPEWNYDLDLLEKRIEEIPNDEWWGEEAKRWIGL